MIPWWVLLDPVFLGTMAVLFGISLIAGHLFAKKHL